MALARKTFLLFGNAGSTNDFGQFGSGVTGTPVNTKDIATIQALTAWVNGLQDSVYGGDKLPFLQEMNSLFYVISYMVAYILEKGIPEWDPGTTYDAGSFVLSGQQGVIYYSKTNFNTNNPLPTYPNDNANWAMGISQPAEKIVGQVADNQIAGMAASKLIGTITAAQIASVAASVITGLITDAQIQAMAAAKLTGQVVNAQIQSVDISKVTGTITVSDGAITRVKLATGTGSISGAGGSTVNVTMQDYTFFPSILTHAGQDALNTFPSVDLGDTVGRFSKGSSQAYDIRWRYVTASDNPRIWAVVDNKGELLHVWESEDPVNHGAMLDDGEPEICPFSDDMEKASGIFKGGMRIVSIPIPNVSEIKDVVSRLTPAAKTATLDRYLKKIGAKKWIDGKTFAQLRDPAEVVSQLPDHKKVMGGHWLLRSISGRHNVARFLRHAFQYSAADNRLVFKTEKANSISPDGAIPKEFQ